MQRDLWGYVETGVLQLHTSHGTEPSRMMFLMEQYRDRPMDLADATLVAAAESLDTTRIITLDSDFFIYRFHESGAFEVLGLS